ncbi:hypothetical protein K0M31_012847 [Melipona bicolor]|uniref:Uncharacterized protein n=1 Tax=Melipona bicolor TaxID=60889 RepID=A0AA40FJB3_9HYME|nr:hypothetical protein K0M31_012847 [Melipona bicolor]
MFISPSRKTVWEEDTVCGRKENLAETFTFPRDYMDLYPIRPVDLLKLVTVPLGAKSTPKWLECETCSSACTSCAHKLA